MRLLLLPLLLLALAVAACGSDDEAEPATQPSPGAGTAAGPGISIDEAITLGSDEPVLVNGSVWADGDEIFFCDAVLESYAPLRRDSKSSASSSRKSTAFTVPVASPGQITPSSLAS